MSSYDEIRPLLLERFPDIIHPRLVEVYSEYTNYVRFPPMLLGVIGPKLTPADVVGHLRQYTDIGKNIAEIFYRNTYERLDLEQQAYASIDPEFLIQKTIGRFSKAISTLKSRRGRPLTS